MRALTQQETSTLIVANSQGDRVAYWRTLADAGDKYAELALQVATDETFAGRAANRYLQERAQLELGRQFSPAEMNDIGKALMQRDLDARMSMINANPNAAPELSGITIYNYHTDAFGRFQLTQYAWSLSPLFKAFEGNDAAINSIFPTLIATNSFNAQFKTGLDIGKQVDLLVRMGAGDLSARAQLLREYPQYSQHVNQPGFGFDTKEERDAATFFVGKTSNPAFFANACAGDPLYVQPNVSSSAAEAMPYARGYNGGVCQLIESSLERAGYNLSGGPPAGLVKPINLSLDLPEGQTSNHTANQNGFGYTFDGRTLTFGNDGSGRVQGVGGSSLWFSTPAVQNVTGSMVDHTLNVAFAPSSDGGARSVVAHGDGTAAVRATNATTTFGAGSALSVDGTGLSAKGPNAADGSRTDTKLDFWQQGTWSRVDTRIDGQGRKDIETTTNDDKTKIVNDYDQVGDQTWSSVSTTYDAQGRADFQTRRDDNGVRVETNWDQANASPTIASTKTVYDSASRTDWIEQRYDAAAGGGRAVTDYDQAGNQSWSQTLSAYDAADRADWQHVRGDTGDLTVHDWDQAGTEGWSKISTIYDKEGRADWQHVHSDGGELTVHDWDQAGTQGWNQTSTVYDKEGRADWQHVRSDGGELTVYDWDQGGTEGWGRTVTVHDATGRLDWQHVNWDGGELTVNDWDQGGGAGWSQTSTAYDNAGHADWQHVRWDGGELTVNDWDQTNTQGWGQTSTAYDAAGRIDNETVTYDDGSRSVADWDQTNAVDWSTRMTRYDTQGRVDYEATTLDSGSFRATENDLLNQYDWGQQTVNYTPGGQPFERWITFDDGRFASTQFDWNGSWGTLKSYTEQSYAGQMVERTYTYDDGSARTQRWDALGAKDWWFADTTYNAGGYVIHQEVQRDNGSWVTYDMGRGGSPVEPGSFWRDATPAGLDRDYNDYDDYGHDDPSGGPGGSGGHLGSRPGGYYYGTPGKDDYIGYVYASDIDYY